MPDVLILKIHNVSILKLNFETNSDFSDEPVCS